MSKTESLDETAGSGRQAQGPPAGTGTLGRLLARLTGPERAAGLLSVLEIEPALFAETGQKVPRVVLAQALNMLLFEDLLVRVPAAAAYVERCRASGRTVLHDHGAVRTVALAGLGAGMGTLPDGQEAMVRLLRPLGYALHGVYPLERLKMTGRSYAHADLPEALAQFFISELHVDRFSQGFQEAVVRVTADSVDPLTAEAAKWLQVVEAQGELPMEDAARLLPVLTACFARQHGGGEGGPIVESDYEVLLAESAEMAWIATEGNAFNHVTDRVADVDALAAEQKTLGVAMKETVERSATGRVRQTALLAARVRRRFRTATGELVEREVPGSFLEFITRLPMPADGPEAGRLDLGFDSSNAQAIFKMTAGRA